jgi:hypothetical protein
MAVVTYHNFMQEANTFLESTSLVGAGIGGPSSVKQREAHLRRGSKAYCMPVGRRRLRRRQSPSESMLGVKEAATMVKERGWG